MSVPETAPADFVPDVDYRIANTNGDPDEWGLGLTSLWDRIARHDFEPDQPLNFTHRLARDKGWTTEFARGAVMEYRRFCFLTFAVARVMTPSEEVDEVWHQHLTYTRDYWDVWCWAVLGAPLHHDPTEGGPDQDRHFRARYAATLAAYERFFGPPPELYWPATHIRFGGRPRFRAIDMTQWVALPRPAAMWRKIRGGSGPCC
jgi:hypothetical protein